MSGPTQFVWMMVQSFVLGATLCGLVRARRWLGIMPIVVTVGALQFLQIVLALSVYVEVVPGYLVSPGSTVLFPATLLGVLLVYILEDAEGVRRFIYGLFVANVVVSVVTLAVSLHMSGPAAVSVVNVPHELFQRNPRVLIVGSVTLLVDTILVILLYEALSKVRWMFIRVWLTLATVLAFDTIAFVSGSFAGQEQFVGILAAGLVGKTLAAGGYALSVLAFGFVLPYWETFPRDSVGGVFDRVTYRESYQTPQDQDARDPLTGLFNSLSFRPALEAALEEGRVSIVVLDLDEFTATNDAFGLEFGDVVLKRTAMAILHTLKPDETAYRIGHDEFAAMLPRATSSVAEDAAGRLRAAIAATFVDSPLMEGVSITASYGAATAPDEAADSASMTTLVFERLGEAKKERVDQAPM